MSQPPVLTTPSNGKDKMLSPPAGTSPPVDAEVVPRPQRRTFSADYKRRILHEADHCTQPGQLGALLTPATVHYGQADGIQAQRQQVLQAAYAAHPERFVRGQPTVPQLPEAVWINSPENGRLPAGDATLNSSVEVSQNA